MNPSSETPPLQIGQVRLRIPDASLETGRALAGIQVVQAFRQEEREREERLAGLPTASASFHLGAVHLRIRGTEKMTAGSMADVVADALGRKLQQYRTSTSTHA